MLESAVVQECLGIAIFIPMFVAGAEPGQNFSGGKNMLSKVNVFI
jgi:hypothetical protein